MKCQGTPHFSSPPFRVFPFRVAATMFRVQHFDFSGFAAKHCRGLVLIREGYDTSYPSPLVHQGILRQGICPQGNPFPAFFSSTHDTVGGKTPSAALDFFLRKRQGTPHTPQVDSSPSVPGPPQPPSPPAIPVFSDGGREAVGGQDAASRAAMEAKEKAARERGPGRVGEAEPASE